jgi:hypothetical protein
MVGNEAQANGDDAGRAIFALSRAETSPALL